VFRVSLNSRLESNKEEEEEGEEPGRKEKVESRTVGVRYFFGHCLSSLLYYSQT